MGAIGPKEIDGVLLFYTLSFWLFFFTKSLSDLCLFPFNNGLSVQALAKPLSNSIFPHCSGSGELSFLYAHLLHH